MVCWKSLRLGLLLIAGLPVPLLADSLSIKVENDLMSYEDDDGRAEVGRTPHRYVWPAELDLMARLAGLELETRHAGWAGEPFTAESRSHVSVYRRTTADAS